MVGFYKKFGFKELLNQGHNVLMGINHIIPISSAKTIEDVIRLNHYTNFQPLDSYENRVVKKDNF